MHVEAGTCVWATPVRYVRIAHPLTRIGHSIF